VVIIVARDLRVATAHAQDPITGSKATVANLKIKTPKQQGQGMTQQALCLLDRGRRRGRERRESVHQAGRPRLQVLGRTAPVDPPVAFKQAGSRQAGTRNPREVIEILARGDQRLDGVHHLVVGHGVTLAHAADSQRGASCHRQAGGIRDQVLALGCLRLGYPTGHAKGADLLPPELTASLVPTLVCSLGEAELRRALAAAAVALAAELEQTDAVLAARLRPMLVELTGPEPGVRR